MLLGPFPEPFSGMLMTFWARDFLSVALVCSLNWILFVVSTVDHSLTAHLPELIKVYESTLNMVFEYRSGLDML